MKRDYEKLCNLLLIPYDQAVERDLIEDMPDNDLHNLISFLIDDALNYSNDKFRPKLKPRLLGNAK